MVWSVRAERLLTSDFSGAPRVYQPVRFPKNIRLKGLRAWLEFFNSPAFDSLRFDVYADNSGIPGAKIASTSVAPSRAEMFTLAAARKEIPFTFDPEIWIKGNVWYYFAPCGVNYIGNESSHIAWHRAYPDPTYPSGETITYAKMLRTKFKIAFFGVETYGI